jgi:hypothetical protein
MPISEERLVKNFIATFVRDSMISPRNTESEGYYMQTRKQDMQLGHAAEKTTAASTSRLSKITHNKFLKRFIVLVLVVGLPVSAFALSSVYADDNSTAGVPANLKEPSQTSTSSPPTGSTSSSNSAITNDTSSTTSGSPGSNSSSSPASEGSTGNSSTTSTNITVDNTPIAVPSNGTTQQTINNGNGGTTQVTVSHSSSGSTSSTTENSTSSDVTSGSNSTDINNESSN